MEAINARLESQGLKLREGTIVDDTIIAAPPSTKNRNQERDPEMHQTKEGNQWHFGMKAHIGVDAETGIVHSLSATAANAHDVTEAHNPLHGGETVVWGDAGYQGVHKREENLGLEVEWRVTMRPGKRRQLDTGSGEALAEKAKATVRAKVEHPFLQVKRLFGYAKVRYRGLAKNAEQMALLFGLGNLLTTEGLVCLAVSIPVLPHGSSPMDWWTGKGAVVSGLEAIQQAQDGVFRPLPASQTKIHSKQVLFRVFLANLNQGL